jgi:hypothetical protein
MTGHRRRKGAPLKADRHAQSSWAHFQWQLDNATTPERKVGVVDGYLRAALKHAPPGVAQRAAAEHFAATLELAQRVRDASLATGRNATVTQLRHTG